MTAANQPTLVEVWAPWCADCRAMRPSLDLVAARHPDVELVRVDVSQEADRIRDLGVRGTPTLIGYYGGREAFRHTGRLGPNELADLFSSLAAGDAVAPTRRVETAIRLGTGLTLMAVGAASGPSGPLIVIGAVVLTIGLAPARSRSR